MPGQRLRAICGLAVSRLRHDRTRTMLAVLGVTLAVISTTLLGSLGLGVIDTGQQKFDSADRDLWISGGPTRISPGTLGGFEGGIVNAHTVSQQLSQREDIQNAAPLLFQTVYIGTSPDSLTTIIAVGVPSSGGFQLEDGQGFGSDTKFYNNGGYNGTRSKQLVIGTKLQSERSITIGEQIHIGGTVVDARQTTYNVTGTTATFREFLGTSTVTLPLAELQAMTGKSHTDQASLITIDVADGTDVSKVAADLEEKYPQYTVRTNAEQLQAIVANRILVVAAGGVLVSLAILAGITLTVNLLALLVFQEQEAIAALRAIGTSRTTITGIIVIQGISYGIIGAIVGVLATFPAAIALNYITEELVGFSGLVQVNTLVLIAGVGIAIIAGLSSAIVAGWRAANLSPLEILRR